MKNSKIYTLATLLTALAAGNAAAEGFAPWQNAGIQSAPDAVQRQAAVGPYYAEGLAGFRDTADARQVDVDVTAWYAVAREQRPEARADVPLAAR